MGSIEHFMDPKKELEKERHAAEIPEEEFFVLDHGGSALITAEDGDVGTVPSISSAATQELCCQSVRPFDDNDV